MNGDSGLARLHGPQQDELQPLDAASGAVLRSLALKLRRAAGKADREGPHSSSAWLSVGEVVGELDRMAGDE